MAFIKAHEFSLITKTALPLMAAFLAQKGMQLVDTLMMGWLGPHALAAGALGTAIFMTVLIFCMGALSAVGIHVARARGANKTEEIKSSVENGMSLALLLSFPCMILLWYSPSFLLLMGEETRIVQDATLLLHGLMWGVPGFLLFLVFREFVSAFSLTRMVMLVCVVSIPLTFLANYVFIYGKYGFPQLGIAGIGYAGAIIMWAMFLSLFLYTKKQPHLKPHVTALKWFTLEYRQLGAMLSLGTPSGLLWVLDMGMFSLGTMMMGHFGVNTLAAHQIAMQCATIAFAVPFGLSMATALQVSHAAGANDYLQVKRYTYIGLFLGLFISGSIALLFIFIPHLLASLFLESTETAYAEIVQLATVFLGIAALFQCFDALQTIMNAALRGLKDTLVPMLLCIACYWLIGVGGAYYFSFYTPLAANGVWYGLTLGIVSAAFVLGMRFIQRAATHVNEATATS